MDLGRAWKGLHSAAASCQSAYPVFKCKWSQHPVSLAFKGKWRCYSHPPVHKQSWHLLLKGRWTSVCSGSTCPLACPLNWAKPGACFTRGTAGWRGSAHPLNASKAEGQLHSLLKIRLVSRRSLFSCLPKENETSRFHLCIFKVGMGAEINVVVQWWCHHNSFGRGEAGWLWPWKHINQAHLSIKVWCKRLLNSCRDSNVNETLFPFHLDITLRFKRGLWGFWKRAK